MPYEIPKKYVKYDRIPKNKNGKIDRNSITATTVKGKANTCT